MDQALASQIECRVEGAQYNYLKNVMRLRVGDKLALFNARDGEWLAVVADFGKKAALLCPVSLLRKQETEGDLWLLFAPVKFGHIDFMAEKATELGVSRLVPVRTDNTAVTRVNTARLKSNAVEAAELSGRITIPEVAELAGLEEILRGWEPKRKIFWCDESGKAEGLAKAATGYKGEAALLIGPEGGFSEREREWLRSLRFVIPVGLGKRIMRADTAAIAALACFQAALGELG